MSKATLTKKIFAGADKLLKKAIKKELRDQGHKNTGQLEKSIISTIKVESGEAVLEGTSLYYAQFINEGVKAESISFKQFPFIVEYFRSKGYDEKQSKQYAGATIKKWMKEGMPASGSMRFSKNGRRLNFMGYVEQETEVQLDATVQEGLDNLINEVYLKAKSETI